MGRAGGTTTALDGVSGSWYVNQVGDERFRHLQREVKFRSVYVFVHRHGRRGGLNAEDDDAGSSSSFGGKVSIVACPFGGMAKFSDALGVQFDYESGSIGCLRSATAVCLYREGHQHREIMVPRSSGGID